MRKLFIALMLIGGLGMATAPAAVARAGDSPKKKEFIFKGDDILGEILKPTGGFITAAKQPKHETLIEYRLDFQPEMNKLIEEL